MMHSNIKLLMKNKGYTQKKLAQRSGCTEASISKYVSGERTPTLKVAKRLAKALSVTLDDLIKE